MHAYNNLFDITKLFSLNVSILRALKINLHFFNIYQSNYQTFIK